MKAYSNKYDRTQESKCSYAEMKHGDKARKKAARKTSKDNIKKELK